MSTQTDPIAQLRAEFEKKLAAMQASIVAKANEGRVYRLDASKDPSPDNQWTHEKAINVNEPHTLAMKLVDLETRIESLEGDDDKKSKKSS